MIQSASAAAAAMGFSSSLQGPASHEALLARQDAEIRLLENMKRCLGLRIKADREYAVALNSFALQAAKNMESVPELAGSTVARAWTLFVEESEKVVRHVKEGAEQMAAATMERLGALYAEKKANRKQYHEEYARVAAELGRLQEAWLGPTEPTLVRWPNARRAERLKKQALPFKCQVGSYPTQRYGFQ